MKDFKSVMENLEKINSQSHCLQQTDISIGSISNFKAQKKKRNQFKVKEREKYLNGNLH